MHEDPYRCQSKAVYDEYCSRNPKKNCDSKTKQRLEISMAVWMQGAYPYRLAQNEYSDATKDFRPIMEDVGKMVDWVNVMSYDFEDLELWNTTREVNFKVGIEKWKLVMNEAVDGGAKRIVMGLCNDQNMKSTKSPISDTMIRRPACSSKYGGSVENETEVRSMLGFVKSEGLGGIFVWNGNTRQSLEVNRSFENWHSSGLNVLCDAAPMLSNAAKESTEEEGAEEETVEDTTQLFACINGDVKSCKSMCSDFDDWPPFVEKREIFLTFDDGPGPGNGIHDGTANVLGE
jgi:hypothetical protein